MPAARPVYLLAPGGSDVRAAQVAPGLEPVPASSTTELAGHPPGLLLVAIDRLPAEEVLAALRLAVSGSPDGDWLPVWIEGGEDGAPPRATPVSVGWPAATGELVRWAHGADDADLLELRHVLSRVARGRHDLNNPLTSAMAETQLALMDVQDPEVREGLRAVEEQLRRMRDLIASLRVLRPPT